MTILLTLLSLLATDCRVHRVPMADTVGCEIAVGVVSRMPQGCLTKSHWVDTCKMRCDTVWVYSWLACYPPIFHDSTQEVHCYPDTVESDSGLITWFGVAPLPPPDSYIPRSYPAPLDSAELSDIREMPKWMKALERTLKQIQRDIAFRTCLDTLNIRRRYYWRNLSDTSYVSDTLPHRTVRDSCRCVYGKEK